MSCAARSPASRPTGPTSVIDQLAKKYLDVESYPMRREGEIRVTVRIHPERISQQPEIVASLGKDRHVPDRFALRSPGTKLILATAQLCRRRNSIREARRGGAGRLKGAQNGRHLVVDLHLVVNPAVRHEPLGPEERASGPLADHVIELRSAS